ncbi:MAG: family 16 glycosylhydrolase [Bacteroidota bacterium]
MKTFRYPLLGLLMMLLGNLSAQDWQLVWSDEFDGESLDETKWSYQTGTGTDYGLTDWGNNEAQYYREQNVTIRDSMLVITAKKEYYEGKSYTSARIRTIDKGDWKYCRVEFRAKMPIGQGLWSAIWMLSTDNGYGGWAASGEIDILENLGNEPSTIHGTLHYGGQWPDNTHKGLSYTLSSGDFHGEFHDFALEWEEGKIRWYVDDQLYQTQSAGWWSSGGAFPAPFNRRFHLLINLAVGGNWPGYPDSSTEFPQELVIDYVRVYQQGATGTGQESMQVPDAFGLDQNYPNPFHPGTSIIFSTPVVEHVTLEVYDATGRLVQTLVDAEHQPGRYQVEFDGTPFPSGLYAYRLTAGDFKETKQMLLMID